MWPHWGCSTTWPKNVLPRLLLVSETPVNISLTRHAQEGPHFALLLANLRSRPGTSEGVR